MKTESNPMPAISIMLVEDEKDTLELLTSIVAMKFPDVTFHAVGNGRTGLELFKAHLPDIVITDINMPEMGGVQLVDKIRTIKPAAKIIVLTADSGKATLENAVGKGFEIDYYILKPVHFEILFAAIEQCLDEVAQQI